MWLHEIVPGSPEAKSLARKILTTLCEIYAAEQGYEIESITFEDDTKEEDDEHTSMQEVPCGGDRGAGRAGMAGEVHGAAG